MDSRSCSRRPKITKELYQRIAAQIFRIVRRIVGQDHVDDVVQDFFVTLFSKINQYRFESSFETWVHRMAVNQSLQQLRKATREQERIRKFAGKGASQTMPQDENSSREDAEVLAIAMNHLSGDQRALLQMKEVEGFGYAQRFSASFHPCTQYAVLQMYRYGLSTPKWDIRDCV